MVQTNTENQDDFNNSSPLLEFPHTESLGNDKSKNDTNFIEVPVNNTYQETVTSQHRI